MTSWPFEYRLEVRGVLDLRCSSIMERSVVNDAYRFTCYLVAESEEVREVILTESSIVFLEPTYALFLLRGVLSYKACRIRKVLDLPTMLAPFLL
jgi:hypothetical protein